MKRPRDAARSRALTKLVAEHKAEYDELYANLRTFDPSRPRHTKWFRQVRPTAEQRERSAIVLKAQRGARWELRRRYPDEFEVLFYKELGVLL